VEPETQKTKAVVERAKAPPAPTLQRQLFLGEPTPGVAAAAALPSPRSEPEDASFWVTDDWDLHVPTPAVARKKRSMGRRRTTGKKKPRRRTRQELDTCPDAPIFLHFDDYDEHEVKLLVEQAQNLPAFKDHLNFAFCCAMCKCSQECQDAFLSKACAIGLNNAVVQSGTGEKVHHACCHRYHFGLHQDFLDPLTAAVERAVEDGQVAEDDNDGPVFEPTTKSKIRDKNASAERMEQREQNDSKLAGTLRACLLLLVHIHNFVLFDPDLFLSFVADAASMLWTDTRYRQRTLNFRSRIKSMNDGTIERKGATLIEFFAGIGSGTVAAKRLGIKIDKGELAIVRC